MNSGYRRLGQYFTTSSYLQETLYNLILNKPKIILEPSVGRGDLIQYILDKKIKGAHSQGFF